MAHRSKVKKKNCGFHKFDVLFRKLLRRVVGPPAGMDWARPWHEILHDWNGRVNEFAALHDFMASSYGQNDVQQYWELAHYISSLEDQRWVKRLMQWQPDGRGRGGRPAHLWHTFLTNFFVIGHWGQETANAGWKCWLTSFILRKYR